MREHFMSIYATLYLGLNIEQIIPRQHERRICVDCGTVLGMDEGIMTEDGLLCDDCAAFRYLDDSSAWYDYIEFLHDWAESHSSAMFYGMTPPCFDEWYSSEHQEEDE